MRTNSTTGARRPDTMIVTTKAAMTLRQIPARTRGERTVARLLDAADRLLAEQGADGFGTREVAAVAGVSVGTVYTWFPHKEALAEALAGRYWLELSGLLAGVADATEAGTAFDPVGTALEVLAAGFRSRPGFLALWFGGLRTETIRALTRPYRHDVAAAVRRIFAVIAPDASDADRAVVAEMVVLMGDGILREAFRADRDGDPTILDEGTLALRAYISQRLKEHS